MKNSELSREEYKILAYYVGSGSKSDTCREFLIDPQRFDAWLAQPQVRGIKRALKKSMLQTQRRTLQRLESKAFEALENQMEHPYKNETRAAAAKIILDEKYRRNQEADLSDMVDYIQAAAEEVAGKYMSIETIDDPE